MPIIRYDCEVVVKATDGRHFRWESVVAAHDLSRAVETVQLHATGLYSQCRIVSLSLDEIHVGHPLNDVVTPTEGVYAINDLSEVVIAGA